MNGVNPFPLLEVACYRDHNHGQGDKEEKRDENNRVAARSLSDKFVELVSVRFVL